MLTRTRQVECDFNCSAYLRARVCASLQRGGRLGTIHKHQAGNGKIKFFPPTDFCLITFTPTCGLQFNRFVVDFMQYTTFNNQNLDLKPFISLWLNTTFLLRGQLNRHGSWKLFHAARVITTHNLQNKTSEFLLLTFLVGNSEDVIQSDD